MRGANAQDRSYLTPGNVPYHDSDGICYVSGEPFNRSVEDVNVITDGVRIPGLLASRMGLGDAPHYVNFNVFNVNMYNMITRNFPIRRAC